MLILLATNSFLFLLCFDKTNIISTCYRILSFWTPSRQGERSIRAKGLQESVERWWIKRLELLVVVLLNEKASA